MQKPISLSLICWFLIVSSTLAIFLLFSQESRASWELLGVPYWYGLSQSLISSVILLVSSIAMLKQLKWGRTLYLSFYPIPVLINHFVIDSFQLSLWITGFVFTIYLVSFYLLFRQDVNDFFKGQYSPVNSKSYPLKKIRASQRSDSMIKRTFSVLVLILAGIFLFIFVLSIGFFEDPFSLTVFSIILGTPVTLLLLLGVFLWGIKRWAESIGWLLCGMGLYSFLMFLMFQSFASGELYLPGTPQLDPEIVQAMTQGSLIGTILGIIGIGLILFQHSTDKEVLATEYQK